MASDLSNVLQQRLIVVGLVWNKEGELLFCKMPPDRGVFPGQWGFPGGGIEAGETLEGALRRELREEFLEYRWVAEEDARLLDLNDLTLLSLARLGAWDQAR